MSLYELWEERARHQAAIEERRRAFVVETRNRNADEIWVPNILNHSIRADGSIHTSSNQGVVRLKEPMTRAEGVANAEQRLSNYRKQCELFGGHQVRRPDNRGKRTSF